MLFEGLRRKTKHLQHPAGWNHVLGSARWGLRWSPASSRPLISRQPKELDSENTLLAYRDTFNLLLKDKRTTTTCWFQKAYLWKTNLPMGKRTNDQVSLCLQSLWFWASKKSESRFLNRRQRQILQVLYGWDSAHLEDRSSCPKRIPKLWPAKEQPSAARATKERQKRKLRRRQRRNWWIRNWQ